MKVNCPGCGADFAVDDNRIPPQGLKVRCPKCFKAIEVGGGAAPASDLEASLGVDLSGPSGEAEEQVPDDGWGDAEFTAPDAPVPDLTPGAEKLERPRPEAPDAGGGEDWDELDSLSADDLSLIGTYERVATGGEVVDDVWGNTGEMEAAETEGEEEESLGSAKTEAQRPVTPPPDSRQSPFSFEGTLGDIGSAEAEEAEAPSFEDELGGGFSRPIDPAELQPVEEEPQEQISDDWGGAPEEIPSAPPAEMESLEQDDDLFSGLPGADDIPETSGEEAPDSIFAIEERSGVFSSSEFEGDGQKTDSGADDGWDFGNLTKPEPEPGGTEIGMPDFADAFQRDSLTHPGLEVPPEVSSKAPEPAAPIGGGPTLDDIDFASLLDEVPGDKGTDSEVFFVDSPSVPEGGFEKPKGGDSFSMEEISFDELDSLQEPSTEFETTGETAGDLVDDDLLDLDMDPADMGRKVAPLEGDLAMPQMSTEASDRPRPRRRKRRSGLGIVVVLVVLAVAGVGAWQLGVFDELLGTKPKVPLKLPTKAKRSEATGPRLLVTQEEFDKRLQTLAKQLEIRPQEKVETEEEMMWVLAWYQFLFPDGFKLGQTPKKEALPALFDRLRKSHAGQVFKLKVEAMELGSAGKWQEASDRYQEYLALKARKMAELLEKHKINSQVAREDNLLSAWFAVETGKYEEARAVLKDLQGEKQGELYPALLEIRIFAGLASKAEAADDKTTANTERTRAVDRLKEVVEKVPEHIPSKLLLSHLLARQGKYDEAIPLALQCLGKGKEKRDFGLQIDAYRALAGYLQETERTDELFKLLEEMKVEILGKKTGLPEPEDLLLILCRLYLDKNLVGQALGALELCGENCSSPDYYLLHARAYEMSKLLHTAIEKAKLGHEKYPKNADLLMLLARLARETGQTNSAVAYLEQILSLRPDNTAAALTLANLFLEIQDPPNARKVLLQAERYVEDSLPLQEMLAQINEAMGDDPGTISALTKILELKGEAPAIRKKLASYLVRQGNYQDALSHYEILEKKGMITPELRQDYAKCLRATGRTQDAVDVLKELLRDNPGDVETARFLADIYLQKEDYFNAKFYLEATRRADTKNAEVHYLIGTTCIKLQDDDCALEGFERAVELEPEKLEYVEQLANLLFKRSRKSEGAARQKILQQARKYFRYIITKYEDKDLPVPEDRRNADVYFNHGQILFETGHYETALKDLDKAMYLAKHRFDMLVTYADTLYKMNRYNEAIKYYQEMIDSDVEKAHAYFFLGKIHLVRDQREKAKGYFLQGIGIDAKAYPDAHKHLGDIFREKGLRKKAIDHYRTFLKLVPPNDPAADEVRAALRRL